MLALATGLLLPLAASAHTTPTLPLTESIVNALIADAGCNAGVLINENLAIPPDRKVGGSNNRFIGDPRDGEADIGPIAIWANADNDPKELTLDVSGQHNVIDGDAVTRSHLKVSASQSLFRHATEYGTRSVSDKNAFDLSGQNNCFNLEPDQVPRNSPTAPDGFPFEEQFDPDGDGNVLEHFDPIAGPAGQDFAAGIPAASYRQCRVGSQSNIAPPLHCDTGSGKLTGDVQGTNIPAGLYYVEGEVLISASNQFADVTIVSRKQLLVNGSVQGEGTNVFNPFFQDLLFVSEWELAANSANTDKAEDALKIEGSRSQFEGIIVAVNGRTQLAGEQNIFTCPVMGDRVRLNGSKLYISGHACGRPGLQIVKTPDGIDGTVPDGVINAGDTAVFKITVTNTGSSAANNVTITDTLPGTGWVENPDTLCTIASGNQLTCLVGVLNAGASFTVFVERPTTAADCAGDTGTGVRLDNGSQTVDPSDDALATATGVPTANDPGSIIVRCPDAKVEKTPDNGTVNAGSNAVFDIVVTALGPGTSFNVNLTDNLPNGDLNWSVTAGADQPPAGPPNSCAITGAVGSQVLTCSFGDIPNGQTRTVQVSSPTDVADCGKGLITNPVSITGDGDRVSGNNSDTGSLTVVCGAIRILKNSTKGGRVTQFGTVFGVDGPDDGTVADFNVTDDNTTDPPDEDADKGEICVDGLQIGGLYTVTEVTPPTGYGPGTAVDNTAVAVAGSCQTATFGTDNVATFSNPPLADIQVQFRDGGSGETVLDTAGIVCTNATGTTTNPTVAGWDNTELVEDIQVTAATITITCTIPIDP